MGQIGLFVKLLTAAASNAKTAKNASQGNYLSYILHLSPYKLSGVNLCPMASKGCAAACLNTAGRGRFKSVAAGRLRKSKLFLQDRPEFLRQLVKDLEAVLRKAAREASQPVVRLNGTSDIDWTAIKLPGGMNVFEAFPAIQFYDYTKVLRRLKPDLPPNYDLTFSKSETNEAEALEALRRGFNVAAVFEAKIALPTAYLGHEVIDGDSHDLRFTDVKGGVWVGLKAKGDAKRDTSGFVIKLDAAG